MNSLTSRSLGVASIIAVGTLLVGCSNDAGAGGTTAGDGTSSPTPAAASAEPDAGEASPEPSADATGAVPDDDAEQADTSTVFGTAVVDGVEYELHELRRCEPTDADQVERELELTARGVMPMGEGYDGGDWVQIDVYVQQLAGTDFDQVSWAGPEGVFGTDDATEVTYSGDRVSGSAAMVDSLTLEQPLTVTYDIEVPDEILDCRL